MSGRIFCWEAVCAFLVAAMPVIGGREYCQWESFTANCAENEIIVMRNAQYGRMEYGRCIERDYGYVGCSSQVLPQSDRRCSGRRQCQIEIPDKSFDAVTRCPKDLVRYLIADYQCLKVESPSRRDCYGSRFMRLTKAHGYIASVTTEETSCGSTETPWLIEGRPGQTVNITLHDFASAPAANGSGPTAPGSHCHVYAIFKESHARLSSSVCGGRHRVNHAYTSTTNEVQVRVLGAKSASPRYFMLEWRIFGCPDVDPITGGWVERNGDEALVGCSDSTETWKLVCRGTKWEGAIGSCTAAATRKISLGGLKFPQTLSIIIIIAVALAIGALILLVGLVCLKRRRHPASSENKYSEPVAVNGTREETYKTTTSGYSTGYSQPSLLSHNDTSGENEYEYVEDLIKPPPPPPLPPTNGRGYTTTLPSQTHTTTSTVSPANCALHGGGGGGPYNQYGFNGNAGFATIRAGSSNQNSRGNAYIGDNVSLAPQYYELDPDETSGTLGTTHGGCDTGMPKERLVIGDIRQPGQNINFGRYSQ